MNTITPEVGRPPTKRALSAHIRGIGTAVPPYMLEQHSVRHIVEALFGDAVPNLNRLLGVFDHGHIRRRFFMQPPEWYAVERGFGESNAAYVDAAMSIAANAVKKALDNAGMDIDEVDTFVVASTSGIATPSLDALLMLKLGVPEHAVRLPIFGLGCAGGVGGLARAAEVCTARNSNCTVFVAVEICSATFQRHDTSKSNLVGTSLFADGAAAVVLSSKREAGESRSTVTPLSHRQRQVAVRNSFSTLFTDTEDIMGWDITDKGFGVRFSRDIPAFVVEHVGHVIDEACDAWGVNRHDIRHYVTHPGGAKVIAAHAEALNLDIDAFRHSVDVLRDYGNMSSATVLFVLDKMLNDVDSDDTHGLALMSSLGPGFSSELVLLEFV